jgi:hypothetical protein
MNRPQVRMIQPQTEENNTREVSGWEAEQLLRKYGQEQSFSTRPQVQEPVQQGLTFDQMIAQEEAKLKREQLRRQQQIMGPKPITFNGQNGYDSEVRYGSDDDSGFGFKIEITTDMNLPKY